MANTFSQIHLQFVFSPRFRSALIHSSWEDNLYRYITGITNKHNHKILCINGMHDHLHLLIGFNTQQSVADFMQDVKADSSQWINKNKFCKSRFEWQSGYGVFSYSQSQVLKVIEYFMNQKNHHRKLSFLDEYKLFLEKFEIDFNEKYIVKEPE